MKRLGNNCWKTRRARLAGRTKPKVRVYRLSSGWKRYRLKDIVIDVDGRWRWRTKPRGDGTFVPRTGVCIRYDGPLPQVTLYDYTNNEPKA